MNKMSKKNYCKIGVDSWQQASLPVGEEYVWTHQIVFVLCMKVRTTESIVFESGRRNYEQIRQVILTKYFRYDLYHVLI